MSQPIVVEAKYEGGNVLSISFADGHHSRVDFAPYFELMANGDFRRYREPRRFRKFHIEMGNVVWGKDWDLIFPVDQLYAGALKLPAPSV